MNEEVNFAALQCFSKFRVGDTKDKTGILIFVSLFERSVMVLGDVGISAKIPQIQWEEIRNLIIDGIRNKQPAEGIKRGILRCGEILKKEFPVQTDDANELPNQIYLID